MVHVKGAGRLLELRGPPTKENPLDMSLYNRVRTTAVSIFQQIAGLYLSLFGIVAVGRIWQPKNDIFGSPRMAEFVQYSS